MGKPVRLLSSTLTDVKNFWLMQVILKCMLLTLWATAKPIWVVWSFIICRYVAHSQTFCKRNVVSYFSVTGSRSRSFQDWLHWILWRGRHQAFLTLLHHCREPSGRSASINRRLTGSINASVSPGVIILPAEQSAFVWYHHQLILLRNSSDWSGFP